MIQCPLLIIGIIFITDCDNTPRYTIELDSNPSTGFDWHYEITNQIVDIEPLKDCKFKGLTYLSMEENSIKSINVFGSVCFKDLEELYMNRNKIDSIQVLERVPFVNIIRINFDYHNDLNIIKNNIFQIQNKFDKNIKQLNANLINLNLALEKLDK